MSSREGAEDPVPEVLVRPATEADVSDGLPSLSTLAAGAGDIWHFLAEEEVL